MENIIPAYLQYGILGVLSLVLVGVGGWLTWYAKEQQSFIRALVSDLNTRTDTWRTLVEQSITAQKDVVASLSILGNRLQSDIALLRNEHTEIKTAYKDTVSYRGQQHQQHT